MPNAAKRVSFGKRGKTSVEWQGQEIKFPLLSAENTINQVPGYEFESEGSCIGFKENIRFFAAGTRGSMTNGGR